MAAKYTQTEVGKKFGLSAVAIGKELASLGLRDAVNKCVTQLAIDKELGRTINTKIKGNDVSMTIWYDALFTYMRNADIRYKALEIVSLIQQIYDEYDAVVESKAFKIIIEWLTDELSDLMSKYKNDAAVKEAIWLELDKRGLKDRVIKDEWIS